METVWFLWYSSSQTFSVHEALTAVVCTLLTAVTYLYTSPSCSDTLALILFSLLLHNFNFAATMSHNLNICVSQWSLGFKIHSLRTTALDERLEFNCTQSSSWSFDLFWNYLHLNDLLENMLLKCIYYVALSTIVPRHNIEYQLLFSIRLCFYKQWKIMGNQLFP